MEFSVSDMNALAIVIAAIVYFFVGMIWYSPMLFAEIWKRETGKTEEKSPNPFLYILCFILTVFAAFALACLFEISGVSGFVPGLFAGLMAGLALVAASAITMLFDDYKKYKLFLINAGYHAVAFPLMGVILGLWQ